MTGWNGRVENALEKKNWEPPLWGVLPRSQCKCQITRWMDEDAKEPTDDTATEQMRLQTNKSKERNPDDFNRYPGVVGRHGREADKTNDPKPCCSSCYECSVTLRLPKQQVIWCLHCMKYLCLPNPCDCRKLHVIFKTACQPKDSTTAYSFLSLHPSFVLIGMQPV